MGRLYVGDLLAGAMYLGGTFAVLSGFIGIALLESERGEPGDAPSGWNCEEGEDALPQLHAVNRGGE